MIRVNLDEEVARIGEAIFTCNNRCAGIVNDMAGGRPPRCLFLEQGKSNSELGIVVVGLNPGNARDSEIEYYQRQDNGAYSYAKTVRYWQENLKDKHQYYLRLKAFIALLNIEGPILWTELVKCESYKSKIISESLSIKHHAQTFRSCSRLYLSQEIEVIDKSWPIVGVGFLAYQSLAFLYPTRTILGVPHPTGSYGDFPNLMRKLNTNPQAIPPLNNGYAVWLA